MYNNDYSMPSNISAILKKDVIYNTFKKGICIYKHKQYVM